MTQPQSVYTLGLIATTLLAHGCRDYTCLDLANCPTEGDAAVPPVCSSGMDCTTSASTSPASVSPSTSVTAPTPSPVTPPTTSTSVPPAGTPGVPPPATTGSDTSSSTTDSTPAETGPDQTSAEDSCPDAPGGICECKDGDTQKCGLSGAKGACADGTQTCAPGGFYGPCDITPGTDDCSIKGNDADCDGTANSNCPCVDNDEQSCGPDTDVGECKYGVSTCANSTYGDCIGAIDRAPRRCDSNQDYDCDGEPDNSLDDTCKCEPGDVQQCKTHPGFDGVGPCRAGTQTCELNGDGTHSDWGDCSGDVAPQSSDTCIEGNNADCSGQANSNCTCIAGRTDTCGVRYGSKGICASVSLTCQNDGMWPGNSSCTAAAKQEICNNGLDDNCDGTADDANSCPCNQTPSPCAHGACNTGSGSNYSCDCTGTGYEGTLCDKPIAQTITGPTSATSCEVQGISDSGTAIAAQCEVGESISRGYFWTQSGGWVAAAAPAGYPVVLVTALSSDGSKAAATIRNSNGTNFPARWSGLNTTGVILNTPDWKDVYSMSANGNTLAALDPGGNLWVWTGGGSSAPINYTNGGVSTTISGDGTKIFTSDNEGFRIWTSSTASTVRTLASMVIPTAASNDGSAMVAYFLSGSPDTIYKYSASGNTSLNTTSGCKPMSISSDGRYVLGKCASGLSRWADATPATVQSLITSTGSSVSIRTDVEGVMSYNAKYVTLPSSSNGVVIVHLPSP